MKILFAIKTIKTSKGGSERVLLDIANSLSNRYQVSLMTFDNDAGEAVYPINKEIDTIYLNIGDAGKKAGAFESLERIYKIRGRIIQDKPDVIIAFQHSMFILMAFSLLGIDRPLISSEHIVPHHYKNKIIEYILMVFAGLLSDRITVLSEKIKNMYPSILHRRMISLPNPVSIADHSPGSNASSSSKGIILNVGRLDPQKDHECLIRAFALLAEKYPGWNLRIIGVGSLRKQLKNLANTTGFGNRISFPGTVDDINREYAGADIFAMSSRYESFGLGTAEAMVYGLPVVGFADCPGTNELIIHNENGFLVEGGERELVLADAIEKLILSPELRKSMGQCGKSRVSEFSLHKIVERWENLIHEVVDDRCGS